jgi:hypothetical protein
VGALANPEVGEYLNKHFVSSFQKVGTFKIVGDQKQGGNVASYFCTPSGNVLDAVAGPVDAATLLREAEWVVETRKMALLESHGDVAHYKQLFRLAHAERLPPEPGLAGVNWPLLPLDLPTEPALAGLLEGNPVAPQLDQQAKVHLLLARYPLAPLDRVYKAVYEKVLNEAISARPVSDGHAANAAPAQPAWGKAGRDTCDPLTMSANVLLSTTPSPEDLRAQRRAEELRHARNDPPATEVYAAGPLNALLADLERLQDQGESLRTVTLGAEALAHVNVTSEPGGPTPGLLHSGKVRWPLSWHEPRLWAASAGLRGSVEGALSEALAQAKKGPVEADLLLKLRDGLKGLDGLLTDHIHDVSPSQFIQAQRYLTELGAALEVLKRDDASRYVDGSLALDAARIKTVSDLVAFMKEKGLTFAPAVGGDETAYLALHRALVSCHLGSAPAVTAARGDL